MEGSRFTPLEVEPGEEALANLWDRACLDFYGLSDDDLDLLNEHFGEVFGEAIAKRRASEVNDAA